MQLGLKGALALVTGGSKGIGLACARALQAEGARVVIASRSQAHLDRALGELPGAQAYAVDFRDAAAAAALIARIEDELGPIDILVNSAGAAQRTPVDELSPDAWRAAMDAKFFAYVHAIDPAIKRMGARGRGVIVNIIGAGGKTASPTHLAGGAANAALMLATAGLANAYARRGVRVVGLNPGLTETERFTAGLEATMRMTGASLEETRRQSVEKIPLGRLARPEDIADAVAFLASERASYITGVNIAMDGASTPTVL